MSKIVHRSHALIVTNMSMLCHFHWSFLFMYMWYGDHFWKIWNEFFILTVICWIRLLDMKWGLPSLNLQASNRWSLSQSDGKISFYCKCFLLFSCSWPSKDHCAQIWSHPQATTKEQEPLTKCWGWDKRGDHVWDERGHKSEMRGRKTSVPPRRLLLSASLGSDWVKEPTPPLDPTKAALSCTQIQISKFKKCIHHNLTNAGTNISNSTKFREPFKNVLADFAR